MVENISKLFEGYVAVEDNLGVSLFGDIFLLLSLHLRANEFTWTTINNQKPRMKYINNYMASSGHAKLA